MANNYDSLKMEIQGYADASWPKMSDASEISSLTGVSKEQLIEFAEAKVCPHILINKKDIRFFKGHIIKWLKENVLEVCDGAPLKPVPILIKEADQFTIPSSLSLVADRLFELPIVCGIYFLILDNQVIYVGQSLNVASRIGGHTDKVFDRVLALPCPRSKLNEVEAAFIGVFRTKRNMNSEGTRFVHNHREAFLNPHSVITTLSAT
jgi:hypothetical protein